jgi:hypothetical protein
MTKSGKPSVKPLKRRKAVSRGDRRRSAREARALTRSGTRGEVFMRERIEEKRIENCSSGGRFEDLDMLQVEDGDDADAQAGLSLRIKLDPVKAAVSGVRVDAEDRSGIPAWGDADFGIQVDAHPVTDGDGRPHKAARAVSIQSQG